MAKASSTINTKPIGLYFPLTSQNTQQAPIVAAQDVAKPGVLAGYCYEVFAAITHTNCLWLLLASATPGKPEWVRAADDTTSGKIFYGVYIGEPAIILN